MAQPSHIPASLAELARLADEIWFLAGDRSVDASWYSKRAGLAAVYAATELYMTTDSSARLEYTEEFLDRRLEELRGLGTAVEEVGGWLGFTARGVLNGLRSKGVRV